MRAFGRVSLLAGVAGAALLGASPAWAQDEDDEAAEQDDGDDPRARRSGSRNRRPRSSRNTARGSRWSRARRSTRAASTTPAQALQMLVPGLYVAPKSGAFDYVNVSLLGSRTQRGAVHGRRRAHRQPALHHAPRRSTRCPSSMIERIEVLKGGQGLYYGTQAVGGIINVDHQGLHHRVRRRGRGRVRHQRRLPRQRLRARRHRRPLLRRLRLVRRGRGLPAVPRRRTTSRARSTASAATASSPVGAQVRVGAVRRVPPQRLVPAQRRQGRFHRRRGHRDRLQHPQRGDRLAQARLDAERALRPLRQGLLARLGFDLHPVQQRARRRRPADRRARHDRRPRPVGVRGPRRQRARRIPASATRSRWSPATTSRSTTAWTRCS